MPEKTPTSKENRTFTGNFYIFHAFDVGDEFNLEAIKDEDHIITRSYTVPKFFKNYHMPLEIDLPHPHSSSGCHSVRLHNFGTIALTYKIPFSDTFDQVRKNIENLDNKFQEQSVIDAANVYKAIKNNVKKGKFFLTKSSYMVIQVDVENEDRITVDELKNQYGSVVASMIRFEKEMLSEYQIKDIWNDALGYLRGDLIIVDTESSFVYDPDYEEILYLFEFANIQALELRFFDRLLDQKLNLIYEEKFGALSLKSYLPFIGSTATSPVDELGKLKVDIQVIIERMESSIKLVGEPYFSEIYVLLVDKLDLNGWRNGINQKLEIITDIKNVIQHKVDSIRGDMLEVLIIILIFIELLVGLWKH
ncbi:MAG: hypothetical protein WD055_02900 [Candidatus Dependentiae bacterium]